MEEYSKSEQPYQPGKRRIGEEYTGLSRQLRCLLYIKQTGTTGFRFLA
jgi:hypothetical protein